MKGKKFSKREKSLFYITILVISSVLVCNFLIIPIFANLSKINDEIEKKSSLLRRYSRLLNREDDVLSLYKDYQDNFDGLQETMSNFFEKVKTIADKVGLKIEGVKPLPVKEKGYKEISLEIELEGDFKSIFRFTDALETSPFFIRIIGFRLLPQFGESAKLRCRISLAKLFF